MLSSCKFQQKTIIINIELCKITEIYFKLPNKIKQNYGFGL